MRRLRSVSILASSAFVFLVPALHAQVISGDINGLDFAGTVQEPPYTATTWTEKSVGDGTLTGEASTNDARRSTGGVYLEYHYRATTPAGKDGQLQEVVTPPRQLAAHDVGQQQPTQQPVVRQPQAPDIAANTEIITTVTLESVQRIIQGLGFDCSRAKDNGKPLDYLIFIGSGYKIVARVPSPTFIQLVNIFFDKVPVEAVNKWNVAHAFNKASLGDNGNLFLQTEIIVSGGVTKTNIEAQIKNFRDSVGNWARFVLDNKILAAPLK